MHPSPRRLWAAAFVALSFLCGQQAAHAQAAPANAKPVMLVTGAAAGGVLDIIARIIQPKLSEVLAQPVIVEARPGGGGHIGNAHVARAAPDGNTLLVSSGGILFSGVYKNLPYDPANDLVPIAMLVSGGFLLVVPADSPFKTLQELVAYGVANPGKLNFGSTSTGNSTHMGAEMLAMMGGFKAVHVPYKGAVAALTDLIGGRIHFLIDNISSSGPHIRAGKIRALGATTPARLRDLPDVPAIGEVLPGYQVVGWTGVFAPKGTDRATQERLAAAMRAVSADPTVTSKLSTMVGVPHFLAGNDFVQYIQQDQKRMAAVVKAANISID